MIWLLQVAAFVVTKVLVAECYEAKASDFGCKFKDANYNLDTPWTGPWPNDPVYGQNGKVLPFASQAEFQEFFKFQEDVRRNMLESGKYILNTLDPFSWFCREYKSDVSSFDDYFKNFTPKYPYDISRPVMNADTAAIHIYQHLMEKYPKVEGSFLLATIDRHVTKQRVDELVAKHPQQPPPDFQHEHIAGVIKFSIGSDAGYLIMDMGFVLSPSVVLMENAKHQANKNQARSQGRDVQLSLKGDSKSYVLLEFKAGEGHPEEIAVMYIKKSLCSFVETVHKADLLKTKQEIVRYNAEGKPVAFVSVQMKAGTVEIVNGDPSDKSKHEKEHIDLAGRTVQGYYDTIAGKYAKIFMMRPKLFAMKLSYLEKLKMQKSLVDSLDRWQKKVFEHKTDEQLGYKGESVLSRMFE